MVKVIINNNEEELCEGITVAELLANRNIKSRAAVWINGRQLLLAEYETHTVCQGDEIKILRVVAGG